MPSWRIFVCNRWDEARAGETAAAIAAAGDAELDTMIDAWLDTRFADGVPASHSSWSRYSGNVEVDDDYRGKRDPSDAYWTCLDSDYGSDSDGYVSRGDSRGLHYPHERVNSAATLTDGFAVLSAGTCKTATWTDPDCD